MKERITATIDENLLADIDEMIDGVRVKNRSHAIELLLQKSLRKKSLRKALILAGGPSVIEQKGKEVPLCMEMVNNRPVIEHNVRMLAKQGVKDFIFAVGPQKESIKAHFGQGESLGVNISYVEETDPLGTSGSLNLVRNLMNSSFVVCNAERLKEIDLKSMFDFHRQNGSVATIALTSHGTPNKYGVALMNGNKIMSFIEKPSETLPSYLINTGLYIFEPEVMDFVPEGFGRLEHDVFPKLAGREDLTGFVFAGRLIDIVDGKNIEDARNSWKQFII